MCFELRLCAGLCVVLGTGLHFVFNWLGRPRWLAPLLATNESVWEHTKLLTLPVLALVPLQSRLLGIPAGQLMGPNLVALAAGGFAMVALYYLWTGAIGGHNLWLGIGIFLAAVGVCYGVLASLLPLANPMPGWPAGLAVLAVCHLWFSYRPPRLPLFRDEVTGRYGL